MNKTKRIVAGIAALAMVGTCGAALAGCGESSTTKSYSMTVESWSEYTAANDTPFGKIGDGAGTIFNFATWITTGNKVNFDNDGNPVGIYWKFNLELEESQMPEYYEYTFEWTFHADPSEVYYTAMDSVYTAKGYAVEVDGGYHLYVANFASYFLIGEAPSETSGFEVDNFVKNVKSDEGLDLTYFYIDSNLEASGVVQNFLAENVLAAFHECDVLVSGSSITGFANVTDNYFKWTNEPGSVNPGTPVNPVDPSGPDQPDEPDEPEVGPDDETEYSFDPGWAQEGGFSTKVGNLSEETVVTLSAACCNTWKQETSGNGWETVTVTFTFKTDGTVDVEITGGGPASVYTGTYEAWNMMQNNNFVIQLDNIEGKYDEQSGKDDPGVTWNAEEANVGGGVAFGMNTYYWISKGGKIVLSKVMDGDGYQFNIAMGGGPQD